MHARILASAGLAAIAFAGMPAYAQDAAQSGDAKAASDNANPEIVVTAQFRQQNLQDTPLAITAVNAAEMEQRGQTNVSQLANQAPNVTLKPQGQELGPGIIAYIRGVGQTDPNFALEPGVGMYLDDVYLPTLTGSLLDLADVERVEVLRGPQGTLSGRNSLGGSIKVYSTKPKGDNSGSVEVTVGSMNRIDAKAYFDVALSDNLAMRVSGATKNHDGYVRLLDYAQTHPGSNVPTNASGANPTLGWQGGQSFAAGKVALRWTPTPTVEVNLTGDYTRERDEPGAAVATYANASAVFAGPSATGGPRPWLMGTDGNPVRLNCQFVAYGVNSCDTLTGYDRRFISYSNYADNAPRDSQMAYKPYASPPHSNLDNYGAALTIDVDLTDSLKLKSISAWRHYTSDWSFVSDGAPVMNQLLDQGQENTQWSQEIRLSGKAANNTINYTVGGFYFHTKGLFTGRIDLNYAGIDFLHGPDPTPATSKALFANVSWEFVPGATINAGLRESWDKKDYSYLRHNPDGTDIQGPCTFFLQLAGVVPGPLLAGPTGLGNQPNCLLFGLNGTSAHFQTSRTDWRVALDYRFSPGFMAYAQVSTGYRGGGVNPRPFYPSQEQVFTPETITAYEVGFKSDLFDRMLRFNVSAFYNDYKNIILQASYCADLAALGQASPCLRPTNTGSAHVKGFEVETSLHPVDGLSIDGALSYLDFKYTSVDTASTGVTANMVTPYTPKWKWSFGIQYEIQSVLGGTLTPRFDGSYQSHIYSDALNVDSQIVSSTNVAKTLTPVGPINLDGGGGPLATLVASNRINGYFLGNARLTWRQDTDKPLSVSLEVQNVFNKYYYLSKYSQFNAAGAISAAPGMPRTWAVTLRKDF
ncbi:MAG: TonB-dependent receptor [Sphingomonadales bacterium]|nr:TonB-dependent receptor [Sphingomonadales bacterium]MDE2567456.1 TonB-dependent receptor [Sphingomonadales bacterium]